MTIMRYCASRLLGIIIVLLTLCCPHTAHAVSIAFSLSNPSVTALSMADVSFNGTVTNNSGQDLNATDFFFNFFAFDAAALTPFQDLGATTDFEILNGTTSAEVTLFDVQFASLAAGTMVSLGVQLEDINGDLSATQTVFITVLGEASLVPEPTTLLLVGLGLLTALPRAVTTFRRRIWSVMAMRDRKSTRLNSSH